MFDRGTGADAASATVGETLEAILDQVRRLFDPSGCAFLIIEGEPRQIRPAAAWFSSPAVSGAMAPILSRPYDSDRPGLTEAAVEAGGPLVLSDLDAWTGAPALRERLADRLPAAEAMVAWEWYRRSGLVACPVSTATGRVLGVLAIAVDRERAMGEEEVKAVRALAGLAAVAVERSELLDREAARAGKELLLKEAARSMPASLELEDVHEAIVEHAGRLAPASGIALLAVEPTGDELRVVATAGAGAPAVGTLSPLDEERRTTLDEARTTWEGARVHVPVVLGPRSFGVLTALLEGEGAAVAEDVRRLEALAPLAAGAIANALDFAQERRVARALARGFVPFAPPRMGNLEVGLVYDPAEMAGGGGDFFGIWPLRDGATAVLVGDVSGKGLEVSATSAMTRFFVEARMWDCDAPAEALSQVNDLLCARDRGLGFATAFLGVLAGGRMRYANAGHVPPIVRRHDGTVEQLPASGMPLAVDARAVWEEAEVPIAAGELLFAATDGLFEARSEGVVLGEERVWDLVASEGGDTTPQELVERAHRLALEWAGRVRDDIVVIALRLA